MDSLHSVDETQAAMSNRSSESAGWRSLSGKASEHWKNAMSLVREDLDKNKPKDGFSDVVSEVIKNHVKKDELKMDTRIRARSKRHSAERVIIRQQTRCRLLHKDNVKQQVKKEKRLVYVRYDIMNIFSVNTSEQNFTIKLNLESTWEDEELNGVREEDIDWCKVWKPNHQRYINLFDLQSTSAIEIATKYGLCTWESHGNGHAVVSSYSTVCGTFITDMDLTAFPFDTQELLVQFTMQTRTFKLEFRLNPFRPSTLDQENNTLAEWVSYDPCVTCYFQDSTMMPIFQIHLRLKRCGQFYVQTVMTPIAMLTFASWGTFCVDASHVETRLMIILTLVTITTAFKFLSINSLPKINYSTTLDKYLLGNLLFQVAIIFETCLLARFSSIFKMSADKPIDFNFDDHEHYMTVDTANRVDDVFVIASLALWMSFQIWVLCDYCSTKNSELMNEANFSEWSQTVVKKRARIRDGTVRNLLGGHKDPLSTPITLRKSWARQSSFGIRRKTRENTSIHQRNTENISISMQEPESDQEVSILKTAGRRTSRERVATEAVRRLLRSPGSSKPNSVGTVGGDRHASGKRRSWTGPKTRTSGGSRIRPRTTPQFRVGLQLHLGGAQALETGKTASQERD